MINIGRSVSKLLIISLIIYLHLISTDLLLIVKMTGLLDVNTDQEFIEIGKIVSDRAKSLQHNAKIDLRVLFEIHTLTNRVVKNIDWEKEYQNRVNPELAQIKPDFVYKEAKDIFIKGRLINENKNQYRSYRWDDFWRDRLEWGTTGSFFSPFPEDNSYMEKFDKDFRNKFMYFISLNNDYKLQNFLNREPALHASASIKYEWTKERAIYGCDVTNYTITHFVMQNCEELLAKDIAIGANSNIEIAKKKINYILYDRVPFCLDFEDFNSQHSASSMKAVICAYIDTWQDKMSNDQLLAAKWLVESIDNQIVHDNTGLKIIYKSEGTLLSGWRLTSFINSILNQVYFNYIQGTPKQEHTSIHSGDDIMVGITNLKQVQVIYRNCDKANIRLSPLKCFVGSVAEFLRFDHGSKQSGQYLTRSIATFVAGKIESKPAFNIRDIISALIERGKQVINRGGSSDIIVKLVYTQIVQQCKRINIAPSKGLSLLEVNRIQGGLSDLASIKGFRISFSIDYEKLKNLDSMVLPKIQPGVYIYVKKCLEHLKKIKIDPIVVATRIQNKINIALARIPNKMETIKLDNDDYEFDKRIINHKGKYKEYVKTIPEYGKIQLIGKAVETLASIGRSTLIGAMMARSHDPMRCLKITTM